MTDPLIRTATRSDRPTLVRFMRALNEVEHQFRPDRDLTQEAADQHLAHLEAGIEADGGFITVVERSGQLIGFLVGLVDLEDGYYIEPDWRRFAHITDIYIDPSARKSGIGKLLLKDAEDRFAALGFNRVRIIGLAANQAAMAAYEASGYERLEIMLEKKIS